MWTIVMYVRSVTAILKHVIPLSLLLSNFSLKYPLTFVYGSVGSQKKAHSNVQVPFTLVDVVRI